MSYVGLADPAPRTEQHEAAPPCEGTGSKSTDQRQGAHHLSDRRAIGGGFHADGHGLVSPRPVVLDDELVIELRERERPTETQQRGLVGHGKGNHDGALG